MEKGPVDDAGPICIGGRVARLTDKQAAFIDHYLMCLNATEAARRAGYKSPRQMGSENLSKPYIRAEIDRRLKSRTMKADEVLFRLGQQAEGLPPEVFETAYAGLMVDFDKVKELGLTHLIKKITYNAKGYAQVELYDAQSALIQLGKHYALFTDRVQHDDWRSEAIEYIRAGELGYEVLANEFGADLATELFTRAGVPITVEDA